MTPHSISAPVEIQPNSNTTQKFSKREIYFGIIALMLLPALSQALITILNSFGIGIPIRLFVHILLPVLFTMYVRNISIIDAFLLPIKPFKNSTKKIWQLGLLLGGIPSILIISTAYILLNPYLDSSSIIGNLEQNIGVTKQTFPLAAMVIILLTPFIEEYFWRGFIYRAFSAHAPNDLIKKLATWFSGLAFAIHHMIIVQGWFVWWQWLIVTIFLALVGVLFNWMYSKTDSILPGYLTHLIADTTIMAIGFHLYGFF